MINPFFFETLGAAKHYEKTAIVSKKKGVF